METALADPDFVKNAMASKNHLLREFIRLALPGISSTTKDGPADRTQRRVYLSEVSSVFIQDSNGKFKAILDSKLKLIGFRSSRPNVCPLTSL